MTPSLFEGTDAADEYQLCNALGVDAASRMLKKHRDTFITWDDLRWIKHSGLNAVRVPIPHWMFGGYAPFVACVEYIDWLVDTTEKVGLYVLLDLHTVPGSQNGWDHSGQSGAINWDRPKNQDYMLALYQAVAARYAGRDHIIGLELMNEPHPSIRMKKLDHFYGDACKLLQSQMPELPIYVSDSYRPKSMRDQSCISQYGAGIDMHLYQAFDDADKALDFAGHIQKTRTEWVSLLEYMQQKTSVIVGEWSIALAARTFAGMDSLEHDAALRTYATAQQEVFSRAAGWFYWSYKTEQSPEWSYRSAVERGWI